MLIDPKFYNFALSACCLVIDCVVVVLMSVALFKRRNWCTTLFLFALFISVITSFFNTLSGAIRFSGLDQKYKSILIFDYNVLMMTEPVSLLALYLGLIFYALTVIRTDKKQG